VRRGLAAPAGLKRERQDILLKISRYIGIFAAAMALAWGAAAAAGAQAAGETAPAAETAAPPPQWQQITSLAEPSRYAGGFAHYDYVNPQAPKGGRLNQVMVGSFDSLNPYIVAGQSPAGLAPFGGGLLYQTLMEQSLEESGVSYPAIAAALRFPADDSWVEFRLNPAARWHDGQAITADDVVWSFNILRQISPYYVSYYAQVAKAEQSGPDRVKFTFKMAGNRELPKIMGDLVILPRHWWEGRDKAGHQRDITRPTLEIPLGSGPYKIAAYAPGKYILWQRAANGWGAGLPQNIGRYNFASIKYSYMLDANAEWEAFKKGGLSDFRFENIIGRWQRSYDFAAVKTGAVKRAEFPYYSGIYQAYYFNTRRAEFADKRVRQALSLALDFAAINKALFYDKYQRLSSYYGAQQISQNGAPQGRERQLLADVRARFPAFVPAAALDTPFHLPNYAGPGDGRRYLGEAMALLRQAGWHLRGSRLVNAAGQQFSLEFLFSANAIARPVAFYADSLRRLGIAATMRIVDSSQYANRLNNFDFDIIMGAVGQSSSPGNEQAGYFGSAAAERPGSSNYAGIKNPAIDALISHLLAAQTREEVVATARAIDVVLLWNYYSVPAWRSPYLYMAYWDKFGRPAAQPAFSAVDIFSWWADKGKEKALAKAGYSGFADGQD